MFDGRIISGIAVFVAVAEAGSYPGAAERLGLSRSGIGKAIARLEERTGLRLFDRTSRALKLTDEGRVFYDEVVPLLEQLSRAAAPSRPEEIRGRLRVSADAAFGTFLLMPSLLLASPAPRSHLSSGDFVSIRCVRLQATFPPHDIPPQRQTFHARPGTLRIQRSRTLPLPMSRPIRHSPDHQCRRASHRRAPWERRAGPRRSAQEPCMSRCRCRSSPSQSSLGRRPRCGHALCWAPRDCRAPRLPCRGR